MLGPGGDRSPVLPGNRAAVTSPWVKSATPAALQGAAEGPAFFRGNHMKTDIEAIVAEYARR